MSQLVGVHGIGNEYLGRHQILNRWAPALSDGLQWAVGHPSANQPDLDVAFYGHLFRSAAETTEKGPAEGRAAAELADLDADELGELTEAVQEIVPPAGLANAEAATDKALMWLPVPAQRLVGAVERHFPRASGIAVLSVLRQVGRYLRDAQIKAEIDQITAAPLLAAPPS